MGCRYRLTLMLPTAQATTPSQPAADQLLHSASHSVAFGALHTVAYRAAPTEASRLLEGRTSFITRLGGQTRAAAAVCLDRR
jgi:hypothetical protein